MAGPASVLVLGGQRSGKSHFAESLVIGSGRTPVYIATATSGDDEMAQRIAEHRARRGPSWRTLEAPLDLAPAIADASRPDTAVLVDCLTLWLTNVLGAERALDMEYDALVGTAGKAKGPLVLVSNEVGSGIVPDNPLARRFTDALGTLNQRVAAVVTRVVLVAAGLPVVLKPGAPVVAI